MSKFDEKVQMYKAEIANLGLKISDDLLTKVSKGLGPSIYLTDASLVSGSDKDELDRVKNNFLIKKLGLSDGPALDKAIAEIEAAKNQDEINNIFIDPMYEEQSDPDQQRITNAAQKRESELFGN